MDVSPDGGDGMRERRESRERERRGNGIEGDYKLAESPGASPSLLQARVNPPWGRMCCTLRSCPDDRYGERRYRSLNTERGGISGSAGGVVTVLSRAGDRR